MGRGEKTIDHFDKCFEKLSDKEKLNVIFDILSKEADKPDSEMDQKLIIECYDLAENLVPAEEKPPKAELNEKFNKMIALSNEIKKAENQNKKSKEEKHYRFRFKVVAAVAAVFILLFATLSVVAASGGYSSAIDLIMSKLSEISEIKPGESIKLDGVTLIKNGKNTKYKTVEELLKAENIDILFPSVPPDGICIEKITYIDLDGENYSVTFDFTPAEINFDVESQCVSNFSLIGEESIVEKIETKDGNIFYVSDIEGRFYQAIGQIEGKEYTIQSANLEYIKYIIDNFSKLTNCKN